MGRDTTGGATAKATIIFCCALTDESGDQEVISKLGPQPGHSDKKPQHKCSRCEWTLNECPQRLAACHRQKLILKTIFYDSIAPPLTPLCIPYAERGKLDSSDGWFKVLAILLARPFLLGSCLLDMTLRLCFLVFSYILSLLKNAENEEGGLQLKKGGWWSAGIALKWVIYFYDFLPCLMRFGCAMFIVTFVRSFLFALVLR